MLCAGRSFVAGLRLVTKTISLDADWAIYHLGHQAICFPSPRYLIGHSTVRTDDNRSPVMNDSVRPSVRQSFYSNR